MKFKSREEADLWKEIVLGITSNKAEMPDIRNGASDVADEVVLAFRQRKLFNKPEKND